MKEKELETEMEREKDLETETEMKREKDLETETEMKREKELETEMERHGEREKEKREGRKEETGVLSWGESIFLKKEQLLRYFEEEQWFLERIEGKGTRGKKMNKFKQVKKAKEKDER